MKYLLIFLLLTSCTLFKTPVQHPSYWEIEITYIDGSEETIDEIRIRPYKSILIGLITRGEYKGCFVMIVERKRTSDTAVICNVEDYKIIDHTYNPLP